MTRADGAAILLTRGWEAEEIATMSDALVDWIATDDSYRYDGCRSMGGPRSSRREEPLHPTEEASLVAEGRTISLRQGHSRATLAALANITRIGQGRG